jgi:hypothetical protein
VKPLTERCAEFSLHFIVYLEKSGNNRHTSDIFANKRLEIPGQIASPMKTAASLRQSTVSIRLKALLRAIAIRLSQVFPGTSKPNR